MTVTIGIIGYGRIAEHHDMAISAHPDLRVGFVCDLNADRRAKADRPRERKVFVSLNEALVNSAAMGNEWAVVCTPSGAHYHHALLCIEAGYNVLLEKPPTMSSREFEGLVDFAESKGLHLVPVFQNRFKTAWT